MMRIIDSYPGILALGGCFERDIWRNYAAGIAPELLEKVERDSADYDFDRKVRPVLDAALASKERLRTAHDSFRSACDGLEARMCAVLGSAPEADVVFYFGLCNGAGWATRLSGRPAVLIGVEKVLELHWETPEQMRVLLWHELGHLWHFSLFPPPETPGTPAEKALWQLWSEGVAMYAEQMLAGDPAHYHQNRDGWLRWCRENRARLFAEYRRRMAAGASVQDFFGDWCSFEGYSDIGYYLGCELVKFAARGKTPAETARITPAEAAVLLGRSAGSTVNPACPCDTDGCPRHGDCSACCNYHRQYAKNPQTACGRKEHI